MNWLAERLSMRHLMILSVGMIITGIIWMLVAWFAPMDSIWVIPGLFMVIAGIMKIVAVQIWIHIAKLGTDEHRPIKAN